MGRPSAHRAGSPSGIGYHYDKIFRAAILIAAVTVTAVTGWALQRNTAAAEPAGDPVLGPPTLHCLSLHWVIRGDENRNARVSVEFRRAGEPSWRVAAPLFRVDRGAHHPEGRQSRVQVPDGTWLFAGSVVGLAPDRPYQLRLTVSDPDGGLAVRELAARTLAEPAARPLRTLHVAPGTGGGTGTRADPFRGLLAAQAAARAGDHFLLQPGVYPGTLRLEKHGEPGRPVVWRGAAAGVVLDGRGDAAQRPARAIDATGARDVWLEDLEIRNADYGIVAHEAAKLVVRRCRISGVEYGIAATRNPADTLVGLFIADNVIEGPSIWPRTMGIESARGIQVTGTGHVICYNRIRGFADAIDTFPSVRCASIDIHNNDLHELTDDGIELDFSEQNVRCFENRLTNVFQGISFQPLFGGPVYAFRNVLYNIEVETFKLHNRPSGALMLHNTSVKKGVPLVLWTSQPVRNSVSRNNLFVGTTGNYAYDCTAPMEACDFDYDGFAGGPWSMFLRWNNVRYATLEDARRSAPVYRHAGQLGPGSPFASGLLPPDDPNLPFDRARVDLRLKPGTAAIDSGQPLPGFNNGFVGQAPELGAHELGGRAPHYGPRR